MTIALAADTNQITMGLKVCLKRSICKTNIPENNELVSFRLELVWPIQHRQIYSYSDNIDVGPNYIQVPKYVINQIGFSYPMWRNLPLLS